MRVRCRNEFVSAPRLPAQNHARRFCATQDRTSDHRKLFVPSPLSNRLVCDFGPRAASAVEGSYSGAFTTLTLRRPSGFPFARAFRSPAFWTAVAPSLQGRQEAWGHAEVVK